MSRSLDDLRPECRKLADKFLESVMLAGIDLIVTATLRSLAEQAALYAQGRTAPGRIVTNAKPGTSAHNYGLALDVVPIVNGKPDWSGTDAVWQEVGTLGQAAGLEWFGEPGSPYVEFAHFQVHNWRLLIDTQET